LLSIYKIDDVNDSITGNPSDYTISSQYSDAISSGAWNLLLTQECETETLASDSISFSSDGIYATATLILNP